MLPNHDFRTDHAAKVRADEAYYGRLESGARWLASRTGCAAERLEHLAMANLYVRLRLEAAPAEGR